MNKEDLLKERIDFCIKVLKQSSVENCLLDKQRYVGYELELDLLKEKEKNKQSWSTDHENIVSDIIDWKYQIYDE